VGCVLAPELAMRAEEVNDPGFSSPVFAETSATSPGTAGFAVALPFTLRPLAGAVVLSALLLLKAVSFWLRRKSSEGKLVIVNMNSMKRFQEEREP
jgi:hypothetical protein